MKVGTSMHERGTHERGWAQARTNKGDASTCKGARWWHIRMVRARTNEGGGMEEQRRARADERGGCGHGGGERAGTSELERVGERVGAPARGQVRTGSIPHGCGRVRTQTHVDQPLPHHRPTQAQVLSSFGPHQVLPPKPTPPPPSIPKHLASTPNTPEPCFLTLLPPHHLHRH
jgi:hypothetical protein